MDLTIKIICTTLTFLFGVTITEGGEKQKVSEPMTIKGRTELIANEIFSVTNAVDKDHFFDIRDKINRLSNDMYNSSYDKEMRCKIIIGLYIQGIIRMNRLIGDDFDPNEVKAYGWPPMLPEGSDIDSHYAGVIPSPIKDPKLRAEYEKTVKLTIEKIKYYQDRATLRGEIESWAFFLEGFLDKGIVSADPVLEKVKKSVDTILKAQNENSWDVIRKSVTEIEKIYSPVLDTQSHPSPISIKSKKIKQISPEKVATINSRQLNSATNFSVRNSSAMSVNSTTGFLSFNRMISLLGILVLSFGFGIWLFGRNKKRK